MGTQGMINRKTVLVTIIILLCIFAPLTVVSYFLKEDKNPFDKNPGHDFYYKNKLWFYEGSELLGTYECTTDACDYATSTINDQEYGINYYTGKDQEKIALINNDYAFLKDGALVKLYSIKQGSTLQNYKMVNTYNTNISGDAYILENQDGKWGAVSINENIMSILPFEYSFVGLKNEVEEGYLKSDIYIVSKDDKWYLVKNDNTSLTSTYNEPIIDYNNRYVVTLSNNKIRVYGYDGEEFLNNLNISKCLVKDRYLGIISDNILYIYDDLENNYLQMITLTDNGANLTIEVENDDIIIKSGDNILDTLELNG